MIKEALTLYFIDGLKTREISEKLGVDNAKVRSLLAEHGLRIREVGLTVRDSGREPVCAAVKWRGYKSFHHFINENALLPLSEQADILGVTEKSFARIHRLYIAFLKQYG